MMAVGCVYWHTPPTVPNIIRNAAVTYRCCYFNSFTK